MNWISVKDRLPNKGAEVLVWYDPGDGYPIYEIAYFDNPGAFRIGGDKVPVTHWQPLPAPPQE